MIANEEKRSGRHEILVVEDNPHSLQFLTRLLTENGYRVRPASDGHLALKSVAAKAPDLILLDVKLPDLDGFEVCRRLKSDEQRSTIPVIFVSALADINAKQKGFEAGAVDYITKPIVGEEVLARVKIHLLLHELTEQQKMKVHDLNELNARLAEEIVQRKKLESSLLITQFSVDHASDSLFWIRPDAGFANVNHSACRRLGYSRDELLGMKVFDVDPAFPREAWDDHWKEIINLASK